MGITLNGPGGSKQTVGYVKRSGGGYEKGIISTTTPTGTGGTFTVTKAGSISNKSLARGQIDQANIEAFKENKAAQSATTTSSTQGVPIASAVVNGQPGVVYQQQQNFSSLTPAQQALRVPGAVASTSVGGQKGVIIDPTTLTTPAVYTREQKEKGIIKFGSIGKSGPQRVGERLNIYAAGSALTGFGERITDTSQPRAVAVVNAPVSFASRFAGAGLKQLAVNPQREIVTGVGAAKAGRLVTTALPGVSEFVGTGVSRSRLAQSTTNPVLLGSIAAKGTDLSIKGAGAAYAINTIRTTPVEDLRVSELVGFGFGASTTPRPVILGGGVGVAKPSISTSPLVNEPIRVSVRDFVSRGPRSPLTQEISLPGTFPTNYRPVPVGNVVLYETGRGPFPNVVDAAASGIRGLVAGRSSTINVRPVGFQDFNIPRGVKEPPMGPIPANRALDPDVIFPTRVRPEVYQAALKQGRESVIDIDTSGRVSFVPKSNRPTVVSRPTADIVYGAPAGLNPRTGSVEFVQGEQVLIQLNEPVQVGLSRSRFQDLSRAPNRFEAGLESPFSKGYSTLAGGPRLRFNLGGRQTATSAPRATQRSVFESISTSPVQNRISVPTQDTRQEQRAIVAFRQIQMPVIKTPTQQITGFDFTPPPRAVPKDFPLIGPLGFPGGGGGGSGGYDLRGPRRGMRKSYTPSFSAKAFNLGGGSAKRATGFTGLEFRGLISGARKTGKAAASTSRGANLNKGFIKSKRFKL